jgi:hypothetical protein
MSMRESGARYNFGLKRLRIRARNDDQTLPTPANMIGGAGPFDFSDEVDPTAIPAYIKKNGDPVIELEVDLDGAASADLAAVTVAEWFAAINAALAAHSPAITAYAASAQAVTGRAKFVLSSPVSGDYVQVWGAAFKIAMFGQGKGLKASCSDTVTTLELSPTAKEDTTQSVTDANMKDVEVLIEGYKKGLTGTLVMTDEDFELMELIESGTIDSAGAYIDPDSGTEKVTFEIETWNPIYGSGSNLEDEIKGWTHMHVMAVKGSIGADSFAGGHRAKNYSLTAVNYKDAAGVESGARKTERLAATAWSPAIFDAQVAVTPA